MGKSLLLAEILIRIAAIGLVIQNASYYLLIPLGSTSDNSSAILSLVLTADVILFFLLFIGFILLWIITRQYQVQNPQIFYSSLGIVIWLVTRVFWQHVLIPNINSFSASGTTSLSESLGNFINVMATMITISAIGLFIFTYNLWQAVKKWNQKRATQLIILSYGAVNLISSLLLYALIGLFFKILLVPIFGMIFFGWLFLKAKEICVNSTTNIVSEYKNL